MLVWKLRTRYMPDAYHWKINILMSYSYVLCQFQMKKNK